MFDFRSVTNNEDLGSSQNTSALFDDGITVVSIRFFCGKYRTRTWTKEEYEEAKNKSYCFLEKAIKEQSK